MLGIARGDGLRRRLFVWQIISSIAIALLVFVVAGCRDIYTASAQHILATEGWEPFLQGNRHFERARTSMDDGSIIFESYFEASDFESFWDNVLRDSKKAGWSQVESWATGFEAQRPRWLLEQAENWRKSYCSGNPAIKYFSREAGVDAVECVELIVCKDQGSIIFVCHYAYVR